MNNVVLYREVLRLKDYLEDNPETSAKAIERALTLLKSLWPILERRTHGPAKYV